MFTSYLYELIHLRLSFSLSLSLSRAHSQEGLGLRASTAEPPGCYLPSLSLLDIAAAA
jgi:hypothetical protein